MNRAHPKLRSCFQAAVSPCLFAFLLTGCLSSSPPLSSLNSVNTTPTASPTAAIPSGERAVKFIFTASNDGSFDVPTADTTPGESKGFPATRAFRPDNQLLSSIPNWIPRLEVGISGTCARFSDSSERQTANCMFDTAPATSNNRMCAAPGDLYRVSEIDCQSQADGKGSADDSVYIRAFFSRDPAKLGASENILAVVEFSATGFLPTTADPKCLGADGKTFTQENCSDFVWQAYLRDSTPISGPAPADPQSYFMLIPRMTGNVDKSKLRTGGEVITRQIVLPLAANPTFQVFQLSRIRSRLTQTGLSGIAGAWDDFTATCGPASPLCAGVVIHSITFFRI